MSIGVSVVLFVMCVLSAFVCGFFLGFANCMMKYRKEQWPWL